MDVSWNVTLLVHAIRFASVSDRLWVDPFVFMRESDYKLAFVATNTENPQYRPLVCVPGSGVPLPRLSLFSFAGMGGGGVNCLLPSVCWGEWC